MHFKTTSTGNPTSASLPVKVLHISFLCLLLALNARGQEALDHRSIDSLERDVTLLLLDQDVGALANQLAHEQVTNVTPLLRRLTIYARAGHRERVWKTLVRLMEAPDWNPCQLPYGVANKVKSAIEVNDLAAWRLYYERGCPHEVEGREAFVKLWDQQGDPKELDNWLAAQSKVQDEWLKLRLYRRSKLGTAFEVVEPFAADVNANPRDLDRALRYLLVNNWAGDLQDVAWLADVCEMTTAYENYELGQALQRTPQAAVRLFQRSLALSFTDRDAQLTSARGFRYASVSPLGLNWEKQLRFWTKRGLAQAYQDLQRAADAQPLVEELVAMKGDDFVRQDIHQLAGGVQQNSGQRVVEAIILRSQVSQQETAEYWVERASYYRGRGETELEKESFRKALEILPARPNTNKAAADRRDIVRAFAFFLADSSNKSDDSRAELVQLLRREFNSMPPETGYAFDMAELLTNNDLELNELSHSLFAQQPQLVARLLAARADWGISEESLIEGIVSGDQITPVEKNRIWLGLEKLVNRQGTSRAYRLAQAMIYSGASQRAAPLLLGCLKNAGADDYLDRNQILNDLIGAYSLEGNWSSAEKLLFSYKDWSWRSLPTQLGVIAVSAAKHGATNDAVRLWRLKANLDRRDLSQLDELSRTAAKPQLRQFYSQMKKDDSLTVVPDQALRLLQ